MYNSFFSFKERPFKLVPNPAYLYLSQSHEEALAHLTYAIASGDGFVQITGEVGTGKTTLCRAFLEQLDDNHEAAYIFNPKLDALQLLQSINDEFGIRSDLDTVKELIDHLNHFLMEKRAEGKKVLLLIDEAQKLNEDVLEQLRLLSNLETRQDKLIQIILVGQPELGETLDSYDLRQLSQRITLACHIMPLTYKETKNYIQHRISIASRKNGIPFDSAAFRTIYKYSRGIPRLVNIACDRSLLTAFGLNKKRISGRIARMATLELASRVQGYPTYFNKMKNRLAIGALTIGVIAATLLLIPKYLPLNSLLQSQPVKEPLPQPPAIIAPDNTRPLSKPAPQIALPQAAPEKLAAIEQPTTSPETPSPMPIPNFGDYLRELDPLVSRSAALKAALNHWGVDSEVTPDLESIDDVHEFYRLAAKQKGMQVYHTEGDLTLLISLNLPAILAFQIPENISTGYLTLYKLKEMQASGNKTVTEDATAGYLTLYNLKDDSFFLNDGPNTIEISKEAFDSHYSGSAFILWKDFLSYDKTIMLGSSQDAVITLKMHLRDIGYPGIALSPHYDEATQHTIKEIQRQHGLVDDGVVGPLTKIVLYNEKFSFNIPHLSPN